MECRESFKFFEYFYSGYHVISFLSHRCVGRRRYQTFSVIGGFTNLKTLTDCVLAAFVAGAVIAVLKMLYMRNLRISLLKHRFFKELFSGNSPLIEMAGFRSRI